jgi:O-antigen/teichoic acid export membrane protein
MNQSWTKYLPAFVREKVDGRDYLQNVISNTGWQFADNVLRMGVGLFVGVWVERYLGPGQYGLFSYALAFVALFSSIASLGLDEIATRNIVRDPAAKDEILGTTFVLKLIAGTVIFAVSIGVISGLRPADSLTRWLVGIIAAGTIFQAFSTIELWFHSQIQAKYTVFAKNAAFLFCAIIKIALILFEAPLLAFAWVSTFEVIAGSAGLVIAYRSRGSRLRDWRASLDKARDLLHDSWPMMLSGIAIMIYMRIDQVMLGEMVGSEEVGIYSAAVRLAEVWYFIPTALYWSVLPSIVEAKATSESLFYERLQKFYNLMVFMAYAVAIPVTFLGDWVVGILFGEAYSRAGLMLAVLIWANVFWNLEIARNAFLTTMNWTKIYFVMIFLGCILNIALNLYLIPLFGGIGAVVASVISYWFAAHGSCFVYKPLFKTGFMLSKAIIYPKIW